MPKYLYIIIIICVFALSGCCHSINDDAINDIIFAEDMEEQSSVKPDIYIDFYQCEIGYLYTPIYRGIPTCSIYQRDIPSEPLYFTPEVQDGNCRDLPADIGFALMTPNEAFIIEEQKDGFVDWTQVPVIERVN